MNDDDMAEFDRTRDVVKDLVDARERFNLALRRFNELVEAERQAAATLDLRMRFQTAKGDDHEHIICH